MARVSAFAVAAAALIGRVAAQAQAPAAAPAPAAGVAAGPAVNAATAPVAAATGAVVAATRSAVAAATNAAVAATGAAVAATTRAATAATKAAASASKSTAPKIEPIDLNNWYLVRNLLFVWLGFIIALTLFTFYRYTVHYVRTVACLANDTQGYFNKPNHIYSIFRRQFLDAPLFRRRHHREFKLSTAINVGTLPGRLQTLFIMGYFVATIALITVNIDYNQKKQKVIDVLVMRTGWVAVFNMLPLILMAGRNNPLIVLSGISFDTYNLIHRWLGRIGVLTIIAHGSMFVFSRYAKSGWAGVGKFYKNPATSTFYIAGTIAGCAWILILLHSWSPIRHAFYEFFLYTHILLVALSFGALWIHVDYYTLCKRILIGALALWVYDRAMRLFRIVYRNFFGSPTKAEVELLPGDAVRVTVRMARPWHFRPGQHAYLYMPAIGFHTSHPFTVAWSEEEGVAKSIASIEQTGDAEKGMVTVTENNVLPNGKTLMSFIVRRRTGFTNTLFKKADRAPGGKFSTFAMVEGPYGSQSLHSYGTVLLFAAGVGITHQVPHVRDLVTGFNNGTVAARKIVLIWIIQSPEHLEWIRPWMTTILGLPRRRDCLRILLFVTRPRSMKEIHSPSSSVQMFPGKPNIQALVDQECETAIGAVGITVCGVGALADDVRRASRNWMGRANVEFMEESFSW